MVISFAAEFTAFENYASGRQINVIVARHDSARSLDLQPPPDRSLAAENSPPVIVTFAPLVIYNA